MTRYRDYTISGYEGDVYDAKPPDVQPLDDHGVDYDILGWGNGVIRVRLPADTPEKVEIIAIHGGTVRFAVVG